MTVFGYERTLEVLAVAFLLFLYLRLLIPSYRENEVVAAPEDAVWLDEDRIWLEEMEVSLP